MRAMVAAFGSGDVSELANVVHPNYVDHQGWAMSNRSLESRASDMSCRPPAAGTPSCRLRSRTSSRGPTV